jgi:hypothetical protein
MGFERIHSDRQERVKKERPDEKGDQEQIPVKVTVACEVDPLLGDDMDQ